jgi:hypothetical protein
VSHRPPLILLTVLCVASASLLLAACGGSSPSATSSAAREQQAEVKFADFAKCLREHGVNAEAATVPGGGHGLKINGFKINGPTGSGASALKGPAAMEAAQKACKKYHPEEQKVNISPEEKVARAEAVEKFARCMREHGIEVHASSSEGRIAIQIHGGPGSGGPNPGSPAFQTAQKSCQGLLPFKGKGPPDARRTGAPGTSAAGSFATGG